MALVGEADLSAFSLAGHHSGGMQSHHLMDWATPEHSAHSITGLSRGLNQSNDMAHPFMPAIDSYPPFGLQSQSPFDLGDGYHAQKMEPGEFDYFSPQVSSSQSLFNISAVSPFILQQQASPYGSQSTVHGGGSGGVLEEVNGLLRNYSDMPEHPHSELDLDPYLFGDLSSQQGGHSMYNSSLSSIPGLGGPMSQQQHDPTPWPDMSMLPREMRESLRADNSSMGSENSPMVYPGSDEQYYYPTIPSNWGIAASSKSNSPSSSQQQIVMKQQHLYGAPRIGSSGHGGYSQQEPSLFPRSSAGFSSLSPMSLQQSQTSRLLPHTPSLDDDVLLGTIVPATGLQLVHLLLNCAEAVAEQRLDEAHVILSRLRQHVLPGGNPMQRLAAYFEEALRERLTKDHSSPAVKAPQESILSQAEVLEAFSVFYECIPIGKFGHLTCNQILLDNVEREKNVHVLDLHVWHGMQWPAFLQALALRPGGPPKLRMSAVGSDAADLQETGEKLHECAKNLNVPFEFCPIMVKSLEEFRANMVELRRSETLVVNSFVQFHGILNKGSSSLSVLLEDLRSLNPRVMAFAENDGNHNSSQFLIRFVECLRYYSAVFDAFDASLPPDSPSRMRMEKIFAAQKIMNIIACEGQERVDGHETMKDWHKRMESAHFRCLPLSNRAVSQANLLLNLYYSNGYTLNTNDRGYLALGWHGMPLMGVSAWH